MSVERDINNAIVMMNVFIIQGGVLSRSQKTFLINK